MAALSSQLEAAEQRLTDLDRQRERLEADRGEADRMTRDAAEAVRKLAQDLAAGEAALAADEARRPRFTRASEDAERAGRAMELEVARATADHAGVEAEWRIAEAEVAQAEARLARLDGEARRIEEQRGSLTARTIPTGRWPKRARRPKPPPKAVARARSALLHGQADKEALTVARDEAASALLRRAGRTGRDRARVAGARPRPRGACQAGGGQARAAGGARPDRRRAGLRTRAGGGARARRPFALLGAPPADAEGRYWTGAEAPSPVAGSLAAHVRDCPPQLAARLALVHVAEADDGRALKPGEWLVTKSGFLRRWDGFVARGEGAAEAARLEAENRLAELDQALPAKREAAAQAEAAQRTAQDQLADLQRSLVAAERETQLAAEAERQALRALDQAEAARERLAARRVELAAAEADLAEQREQAQATWPPRGIAAPPCPSRSPAAPRSPPRKRRTRPRAVRCRPRWPRSPRTTKRSPSPASASPPSAPTLTAGRPAPAMPRGACPTWSSASRRSPRSAR
jgi:chromosome segregation protein